MGRVTWSFTASLDGFITGPGHDMSWLEELAAEGSLPEGLTEELAAAVGVIISGRDGYDAAREQAEARGELTGQAYGGAWSGKEIVLTHRPQEIADDPAITAWDCEVREAVRRAQEIAGEKDVQILSADIGRQALEHDLVDEMQIFVVPVFLGDGTRIFSVPGGRRLRWDLVQALDLGPTARGGIYRPRPAHAAT